MSPGFAVGATCSVTSYSPLLAVGLSEVMTFATFDSTFVTENDSGVFRLFERRMTERVAAVSAGATSPKFTPVGSTRNVGRITPEMLTKYSGWCLEFVTM